MMRNAPLNLIICEEPDYRIRVRKNDGTETYLVIRSRSQWKRLSAVSNARHIARGNPKWRVFVEEVPEVAG